MTNNKPFECPASILLSVNKADPGSTIDHLKYTLQQPFYPAVILHPSLGCPLIVGEQGKNEISLFLVAGKSFKKTFKIGSTGKQGGNSIKLVIGAALSIIPWDTEGKVLKNPGKAQMIYPDRQTVFDKITCTYLGELGLEVKDASRCHFANIRTATRNQLKKHELEYLFQVMLKDVDAIQQGGMFEVFWSVRNEQPADSDYDKDFLDVPNRLVRELVRNTFYNAEAANGERAADKTVKPGPDRAYKIMEGVVDGVDEQGKPKQVPIKTIDFGSFDDKVPLMMRHPIYVSSKQALNIAHIGDMHITARQHAYKGKEATVIPGADLKVSPHIGNTTGNNLETCLELMDSIGNPEKDIDLLFIAGDLYDYMHDFDPSRLTENKTGKLWEAMYITEEDDIRKRIEDYPYGINALAFYTLLLYFYNTYQKPVLMISGNHEGYRYPYGISPRVKFDDSEIMKVNDGIPLDHNLTFYEAILLYGPGYDKTIPSPIGQLYGGWFNGRNFQAANFDWFFTAFSPFADYVVTYGDQCLVCLEWGDDESLIGPSTRGGGTLPRTKTGGTAQQIALGNAALKLPQSKKILCTHYTLVNYEPHIALSQSGTVFPAAKYSLYDYGSAWGDRRTLYGDWLRKGSFTYALAGHAHRVGLYTCNYIPAIMGEGPHSHTVQPECLQTKGYLPDKVDLAYLGTRTKIVVSSSAGCMAKQNLSGELSGKGMDFPAATLLYFNGKEHIEIMPTNHPRSKPRFCVACDYIDIMGGGFWESFKAVGNDGIFEMKPYWEKILPKFGEDGAAKPKFIESVILWVIENGETKLYDGTTTLSGSTFKVTLPDTLPDKLKSRSKYIDALFLSIKFNGAAFNGLPGFNHYDYTSPWNTQVGIYSGDFDVTENPEPKMPPWFKPDPVYTGDCEAKRDPESKMPSWFKNDPIYSSGCEVKKNPALDESVRKRKRMIADMSRWEIRRHKKYGEIPYFDWRAETNPREYSYQLKKKKT